MPPTPLDIPSEYACFVIYGAGAVLPATVDHSAAQGFTASYELRLRGGIPLTMRFTNGSLTVELGSTSRADCRISADPTAFLLLSYGRVTPWRVIARGRIVAWGRRPWLATRLATTLQGF